jgi:uncharacterized membrane protein
VLTALKILLFHRQPKEEKSEKFFRATQPYWLRLLRRCEMLSRVDIFWVILLSLSLLGSYGLCCAYSESSGVLLTLSIRVIVRALLCVTTSSYPRHQYLGLA